MVKKETATAAPLKKPASSTSTSAAPPAKSTETSKKAKKEKSDLKRPLSAYLIFSNERRPLLKEKNPTAKLTDISKIIGAEWKELSDEKKQPYVKKSEAEKERYEKEKARQGS